MRRYAWLAICGTLLSSVPGLAQAPTLNANPGAHGYSGYPVPRYEPTAPPGLAPGLPTLAPRTSAAPFMPYASPQPAPAAEPYFVPIEPPAKEPAKVATPRRAPETVVESVTRLVEVAFPPETSEPFTVYEGRPYRAATRHDNSRVWAQGNFIHWWTRRDSVPPLVTTGATGVLGAADTTILLGDAGIGPREFSGAQVTLGQWLDEERLQSLEISGFFVGKNSRQYNLASDAGGTPFLAQPAVLPAEGRFAFASPGTASGSIAVHTVMDFHSLEMNAARNVFRINGWAFDTIVGLRYAYLNDTLTSTIRTTSLVPGLPFNGVPQPAGSTFVLADSFDVTNRFYGGQIGARVDWAWRRFDIGVAAKIAFGATNELVVIDGSTTLNPAVAGTRAPGGIFAQTSNIGRHNSTVFSVLPELTATWGIQVTPCVRVLAGYTLLYWNRIQRAGDQIDRRLDLATQLPTSPTFTPGVTGAVPALTSTRTEFWAQGINVGIELKY